MAWLLRRALCMLLCAMAFQPVSAVKNAATILAAGLNQSTATDAQWEVIAAEVDGDFILGGMFPVHRKSESATERCGVVNQIRGVQRVEAMLWAIDKINNDKKQLNILPGIKLGAKILDSCSKDTYALEQALEFVRDSLQTMDASQYDCADGSTPKAQTERKPVIGVVGEALSEISVQIANLLRLFRIPQISYASTSTILSDKSRFDYFARTLPPDSYQATAMADVARWYNWTYVSTVASEGEYGESGISAFISEATKRGICIAAQEKIPATRKHEDFDRIFNALQLKAASVVVLFLVADDVTRFISELMTRNISNKLVLFASDAWGTQVNPPEHQREYISGMLTIELQSAQIPEFDEYYKNLRPFDPRNPWLNQYWEEAHSCSLADMKPESKTKGKSQNKRKNQNQRQKATRKPRVPKSTTPNMTLLDDVTSAVAANSTRRNCTMKESLPSTYAPDTKVQFIYDAVLAFAHALDRLQKDFCPNTTKVCPAMERIDGAEFFRNYILKVEIDDGYGNMVKFDKNGDATGRYNILNYRKNRGTKEFGYEVVAVWNSGLQFLDNTTIVWPNDSVQVPSSQCSQPCPQNSAKQMTGHDTCCWICVPCMAHQYLKTENLCADCDIGYWPTDDRKNCSKLPELYMKFDSVFSLIPVCYSTLGILLTLFIVGVYIKYNDTPVIKASGRELSYFILAGCLTSYSMSFVILSRPNVATCAVQRFGIGFGFAVIYSAMLTKTNRIYRIFDSATRSARRPPFISPKSQMVITGLLILIQVAFSAAWLVFEKPETRLHYQERRDMVVLRCKFEDLSFFISLIYIMVLITTCTVYAVKTRKIPENFNESKFIGFTMYTTCIVWLAFVPIYFATVNSFEIQTMTLCVSINMNSTVVIACLFLPKMYIILFHPNKNVRKVIMKQANSSGRYNEPTSSTSQCGNGTSYEPVKSIATTPTRERKEPKEKEKKTRTQPNENHNEESLDTSYPVAAEITRVEMTKDGKIIVKVIKGDREEIVENEFVSRRSQFESL